jgi:hypothetical protein
MATPQPIRDYLLRAVRARGRGIGGVTGIASTICEKGNNMRKSQLRAATRNLIAAGVRRRRARQLVLLLALYGAAAADIEGKRISAVTNKARRLRKPQKAL